MFNPGARSRWRQSSPYQGLRVGRRPATLPSRVSRTPRSVWTERRPVRRSPQSSSLLMRNGNNTCVAGSASDGRLKRGLMSENSTHTQSHIDSIARQEHEFLEQRTLLERASDRIAGFAGSMFFVLIHVLLVLFWVLTNLNRVPWIPRFDPYPFSLLGVIVAVEAVVLSSFGSIARSVGERGGGKSHCVEKSKGGTFPLRLEIPQERRDFHFSHRPGYDG